MGLGVFEWRALHQEMDFLEEVRCHSGLAAMTDSPFASLFGSQNQWFPYGHWVTKVLSVSLLICQQFNWTNELDTPGQAVGVPPGQAVCAQQFNNTAKTIMKQRVVDQLKFTEVFDQLFLTKI